MNAFALSLLLKAMLPKGTFFLVDSASNVLLKIEVSTRSNLISVTDKDGQLIGTFSWPGGV